MLKRGEMVSRQCSHLLSAPYPSSEGEVARLEHERFMQLGQHLLISPAAQTEKDQRVVRLPG